jgi:DNA polymerase-3 subunit beta
MKFTVSSTGLLNHLQAISRVINSKNTLPILDNFLFKIEAGKLILTASDLETTLITSMDLETYEGEGVIALSAKILLDTLKEFSDQPLTFDINDENLAMTIKSETGVYNFIGQNGDEYPRVPAMADDFNSLVVPTSILNSGINKTLFATADDELRPVMNGVYFDITTEDLTMVASDAHKLVRFKVTGVKGENTASFILPKKPTNLLKNILPRESGDVLIQFDSKNASFTLSNYKMICRLIEGRYPNYNSVIPQNNPYKAIIDRSSLMNTLKRVSVFSNQASNLVKLEFSENEIHISAQDIDFSISAEEKMPCQYQGEAMKIGFKSSFLIDILANISSSEVVMELADPSRAGLIFPFEREEDEDTLMLLMPMMLND